MLVCSGSVSVFGSGCGGVSGSCFGGVFGSGCESVSDFDFSDFVECEDFFVPCSSPFSSSSSSPDLFDSFSDFASDFEWLLSELVGCSGFLLGSSSVCESVLPLSVSDFGFRAFLASICGDKDAPCSFVDFELLSDDVLLGCVDDLDSSSDPDLCSDSCFDPEWSGLLLSVSSWSDSS